MPSHVTKKHLAFTLRIQQLMGSQTDLIYHVLASCFNLIIMILITPYLLLSQIKNLMKSNSENF